MRIRDLKILAMVECLILWDRIAEKGHWSKKIAIKELYKEGKLSQREYSGDCPFCEYLRDLGKRECADCLWPKRLFLGAEHDLRCLKDSKSEYGDWALDRSSENAKKVLDMLLGIQF